MKCNLDRGKSITEYLLSAIERTVFENGYNQDVCTMISRLFQYMINNNLYGGCHAISTVLYVALSELGFSPKLYVGECIGNKIKPFDHSWLTLDDKIIDLAIYYPLTQMVNSVSGPIILDIDILKGSKFELIYGVNTGLPIGNDCNSVIQMTISEYMNNYPKYDDGLWDVLKLIYPREIIITSELKEKYDIKDRCFIR